VNLAATAPQWLLLILAALSLAAAVEDGARLRISNLTVIGIVATAITAVVLAGPRLSLWENALVFAALLVAGTALFGAGWLGGGDVKFLAALGLWVNLQGALWFLIAVSLAGGALAVVMMTGRWIIWRPMKGRKKFNRHGRIPYGIAIAAGALFAFGQQSRHIPQLWHQPVKLRAFHEPSAALPAQPPSRR
jgi:prepilin peptidase CpaA